MVIISPVVVNDLERLADLEKQSFSSDQLSHRQLRYHLKKKDGLLVKLECDGVMVGYMLMLKNKKTNSLRIYSLAIDPKARNHGYAQKLLAYAQETAMSHKINQLTLEVCEQNHAAIRLYEAAGFLPYGKKPHYYDNGCTALLLRKTFMEKTVKYDSP